MLTSVRPCVTEATLLPAKAMLPTPGNFYRELMSKAGRPAMSMYDGAIKAGGFTVEPQSHFSAVHFQVLSSTSQLRSSTTKPLCPGIDTCQSSDVLNRKRGD